MAIPTVHKLSPAFEVIESLGGKSSVAAELSLSPSTLSRWCQPSPGGTGGLIPQRHWAALLAIAKRRKVAIAVSDLAAVR